jgi:hypothetical protein
MSIMSMITAIYRNALLIVAVFLCILFVIIAGLFSLPHTAASASARSITGYAWSDTIGWISLNCSTDANGCSTPAGNWGLSVDASNNITGYAWSDNVGWITTSATGCPSGTCNPMLTSTGSNTYAFSGWLKALSADNNGWDGWISLSGTSPSYGVTAASCNLAGDAWGSDVVGWIDFSQASIANAASPDVYTCTNEDGNGVYHTVVDTHTDASCNVTPTNTACPVNSYCVSGDAICQYPTPTPGGNLTSGIKVVPAIVQSGSTTTVIWDMTGVESCTVTGSNHDGDGTAKDLDTTSPGLWNTEVGTTTSSVIGQVTAYVLSCVNYDPSQPAYTATSTVNIAPVFQER